MQRAEAVREEPKSPQIATTLPSPSPLIYYAFTFYKSCECAREKEREGESNRKLRHNASSYLISGNLHSLIY